jgi:hypothetical protein
MNNEKHRINGILTVSPTSFDDVLIKAINLLNRCNTDDPELISETPLLIRIDNPSQFNLPWDVNPPSLLQALSHTINSDDILSSLVAHYSERIVSEDIDKVCSLLLDNPFSKKAVLSLWDKDDVSKPSGSACMNYFWFRKHQDYLICRVHMRACDIFTKLCADIAISCNLHEKISKRLNYQLGNLEIFIDCAHIYKRDSALIEAFLKRVNYERVQ